MRILIIIAHPDDMELGMGGSVHKLAAEGHVIYVFQTTNGTYTDRTNQPVRTQEEILHAIGLICDLYSIEEYYMVENTPATSLQLSKEIISTLQTYIADHQIEMIFTHPEIDTYHQDHRITHQIVMAAARRFCQNILFFEGIFNYGDGLLRPSVYQPLSERDLEAKLESLRIHQSEYQKFGGEVWLEQIRAMAKYRGAQIQTEYAEAFTCQQMLLNCNKKERVVVVKEEQA